MRARSWLTTLLLVLVDPSTAIYADEVGEIDSHYALIGRPQQHTTFFHRPVVQSKASLLYSLSHDGLVGAINPKDGAALWRTRLPGAETCLGNCTGILQAPLSSGLLVSALGPTVEAWEAISGRHAWSFTAEGEVAAVDVSSTGQVWVGSTRHIYSLNLETGTVQTTAAVDGKLIHLAAAAPDRVYYVQAGRKFQIIQLSNAKKWTLDIVSADAIRFVGLIGSLPAVVWIEHGIVKILALEQGRTSSLGAASAGELHIHVAGASFAVEFHDRVQLYGLALDGSVKPAGTLPSAGAMTLHAANEKMFVVQHSASATIVYDETAKVVKSWASDKDGNVAHAAAEVLVRPDGSLSVRSALTSDSGDWSLVRNGESLWMRPESLTNIVAATFVEDVEVAPEEVLEERRASVLYAYIHRWRRHLRDLADFPRWLQLQIASANIPTVTLVDKTVVLATREGKIAALRSGKILWDTSITAVVKRMRSVDSRVHVNLSNGSSFHLDAHDGRWTKAESTTISDADNHSVAVSRLANGSLEFPQKSYAANSIVVTKDSSNGILGWQIDRSTLAWRFHVRGRVLQILHRPQHDPIASIGKVMGDRNVLYKYTNPHLLLVTAVEGQTLNLYLLDSLTGTLLYAVQHENVDFDLPIVAVLSEHRLLYSLTAENVARDPSNQDQSSVQASQLIVTEFYESTNANQRMSTKIPHAETRAFALPGPVSRCAMSATGQGITPRSLVCTLPDHRSLIAIPHFMLQARRPIGRDPTAAEMSEGLLRFSAVLPFDPKWVLSHGLDLLSVVDVVTSPTRFESMSLVLAFGSHDIFFTRLSPIGNFDMLGKGFNKGQIVLTLVVLLVATVVLRPMVSYHFRADALMAGAKEGRQSCMGQLVCTSEQKSLSIADGYLYIL